ncbi:MAG: hypothetical protein HYU77_18075 [Betaproteobacteria bacterium]|nr:hypothetical protein [Betaproteobacteria bacterium]
MNRNQIITLAVAAANIALLFLFPPYDFAPPIKGAIPAFEGFYFVFSAQPNRVINTAFLNLEVFVVLINAAIAFLLLRTRRQEPGRKKFSVQNAVLMAVAVNLVVILLFPPFERVQMVTRAALPSFEAFYFVLGDNRDRTIVTTILYLEVLFVLFNGAMFWLLFKEKKPEKELTPEEALALAREYQKKAPGK